MTKKKIVSSVVNEIVVVMNLINGDSIIGVVNNGFDNSDIYRIQDPQLLLIATDPQENSHPMSFSCEFQDWLLGAKESIHSIPYYNVIVWYEVDEDMALDYKKFIYPEQYSDDDGIMPAQEYLQSVQTIH